MRRVCGTIALLAAILGHAGCKNESLLRPPKNPEVYNVPPPDARYVDPPQPPKEYLNQDPGNPNKSGGLGGPGSGAGSMPRSGGSRPGGS